MKRLNVNLWGEGFRSNFLTFSRSYFAPMENCASYFLPDQNVDLPSCAKMCCVLKVRKVQARPNLAYNPNSSSANVTHDHYIMYKQ